MDYPSEFIGNNQFTKGMIQTDDDQYQQMLIVQSYVFSKAETVPKKTLKYGLPKSRVHDSTGPNKLSKPPGNFPAMSPLL